MKRMIVALALAGVAATCGSARADWGGVMPSGGGGQLPPPGASGPGTLMGLGAPSNPTRGPDCYGLAPWLRKPLKARSGVAPGCAPMGPPAAAGPVQQGTLAFPHHPFVRSPRDFFMWGN